MKNLRAGRWSFCRANGTATRFPTASLDVYAGCVFSLTKGPHHHELSRGNRTDHKVSPEGDPTQHFRLSPTWPRTDVAGLSGDLGAKSPNFAHIPTSQCAGPRRHRSYHRQVGNWCSGECFCRSCSGSKGPRLIPVHRGPTSKGWETWRGKPWPLALNRQL